MGKTAFISHASEDAERAMAVCAALEAQGVSCWIAPRDVTPGRDYASEILDGIAGCTVFVVLLSAEANASGFVRREVERAVSKNKPVFPVRLEAVVPSKALELFLSSAHWIDAWDPPYEAHWQRLAAVIRGEASAPPAPTARLGHGTRRMLAGTVALMLLVGIGGWLVHDPAPPAVSSPPVPKNDPSPAAMPASQPAPPAPTAADTPRAEIAMTAAASDAGPCPQRLSVNPALETPFACRCSAEAVREGTVWGTDVYTDDSAVCAAAVHAGAIGRDGGLVTALREAGRDIYVGTARHGVNSHDYGRYDRSLRFAGAPAPAPGPEPCPQRLSINADLPLPYTCQCTAEAVRQGTVWGTDVYTRDSGLCGAAAHAGVVGSEGGTITAFDAPGRDLYVGTTRHGIASNDYGRYANSLRFDNAAVATGPEPCPQRLSISPDLPTPFSCNCSAEAAGKGTIWGTDVYTGDSYLCSAAVHAGAMPRTGGAITVYREAGRDLYVGSARNGVRSHDYGHSASSIRFLIRTF
ncbi:LCCL domain-containing protein [Denitromonas iodatirespirans]|uniref:TIR domain-containing protein n=1 Tax=Denitromonas iodatirespirans TaxID=2795389 RepID=A0A944DA66_DENI1|nr:LCCL domain-containing protein [Denitromonas iodatirespirans]MBT0962804.1 TIR domain-containing protein [Denitromonas iodatirespirans]